MKIKISNTAVCRGNLGSRFECVTGLTIEERNLVKRKRLVLIRQLPKCDIPDFRGAKFRKAVFMLGRYTHRSLTEADLMAIACGGEFLIQ